MGAGVGWHCQVRFTARLDFKVALAHLGTQSSLWETQGALDPSLGLISLCKGESVWKLTIVMKGWLGQEGGGAGGSCGLAVQLSTTPAWQSDPSEA